MSEIGKLKKELETVNNQKELKPFNQRLKKGLPHQIEAFERINNFDWVSSIAINGTEHTHDSEFMEQLRQSKDQTSLFIRHQPDGIFSVSGEGEVIPSSAWLEIKNGFTIEKDSYEQKLKLYNVGNIVIFIMKDFLWNFIENIRLINGNETVANFQEHMRFPVDDEGWICPRDCDWWLSWVRFRNPQASGTPYKEVDKISLQDWSTFEELVMGRLSQKIEVKTIIKSVSNDTTESEFLNKPVFQNRSSRIMEFQF